MGREIEIKIAVGEPDVVRRRLTELGARSAGTRFEINRLFDTLGRELLARGCGLRLREIRIEDGTPPDVILTFKGPVAMANQPGRASAAIRDREETETSVADADSMSRILESLGYREVIRYEKKRETWRWGDVEVALDELPRLGHFVEIEGPSADAVETARERLLLSATEARPETYVAMCARYGEERAGVRVLEFPRL